MPNAHQPSSTDALRLIDIICNDFEDAWDTDPPPRIEEYLSRGSEHLREELFGHLLKVELELRQRNDETISQQAYFDRFPQYIEQLRDYFGNVQTQIETRDLASDTSPPKHFHSGPTQLSTPCPFGDYELLEGPLQGGMGAVYKARHANTGRIVALKLIRPDILSQYDVQQREQVLARFRNEVQAAARLEHDHVVRVYDVGEIEGQSYYTMQFVEGESLGTLLKEGPLPPQEAARYIAQVADGLAAAHVMGILHRDLKPANVMIDRATDRAMLTDFGLAKLTEGESELTATHGGMGSPPWMAPEQIENAADVTTAADVYGLGATLYHTLTGRPPFQGATPAQTCQLVLNKEPIAPRELNDNIPLDLDTICLKCLEKPPANRYHSAELLAERLTRVQRGIPIPERPISRGEKAWRWCKRNPVVAGLSTAVAVALLLGTCVSSYFAWSASVEAENVRVAAFQQAHLRKVADLQASRADRNLSHARHNLTRYRTEKERADAKATEAGLERDNAMKELQEHEATLAAYVETVSEAELLEQPQFLNLKKELLSDALTHYERFLSRHGDDPRSSHQAAKALFKVAQINRETIGSDNNSTVATYQRVVDAYAKLAKKDPTESAYRQNIVLAYLEIGTLCRENGNPVEAQDALNEALHQQLLLVKAFPGNDIHKVYLAECYERKGVSYKNRGMPRKALADHLESLKLREGLAASGNEKRRFDVIKSLNNLAETYRQLGQLQDALEAYERAVEIQESLIEIAPEQDYRMSLAMLYRNVGVLHARSGQPRAAISYLERCVDIRETLALENPTVATHQDYLATAYSDIAIQHAENGNPSDALTILQVAAMVRHRLVRQNPNVLEYESELGSVTYNIGMVCSRMEQYDTALSAYNESLQVRTRLAQKHPTISDYQDDLAATYIGIGLLYRRTDQRTKALSANLQAQAILRRLVNEYPELQLYATDLASTLVNTANLAKSGDTQVAMQFVNEAIQLLDNALASSPQNANARNFMRNAHWVRAELYESLGLHDDAIAEWREALRFDNGRARPALNARLATAMVAQRTAQDSAEDSEPDTLPIEPLTGTEYFILARSRSLSIAALGKGHRESDAASKVIAEMTALQVLILLEKAENAGFFTDSSHIDEFTSTSEFEWMKNRDDYRAFVERLDSN